jgi:hypothetical protein
MLFLRNGKHCGSVPSDVADLLAHHVVDSDF